MSGSCVGGGGPLGLGITLPFTPTLSDYGIFLRLTKLTQDCGFDSVWMADHVTGPSPNGTRAWLDVVTLLSNLCAHAPRLRIGTDVIVAAHRHPVLAAKMLATLDIVSGGRLIVGAGVGYIEKEFAELGAPFADRGAYTDECIAIWKALWAPGVATYDGRWFTLRDTVAEPKPVQQPHPPIWVGSHAPPVLRRAVALADGWHPIYLGFAQYEAGVAALRALAQAQGRTRPLTLSYSAGFGLVRPEPDTSDKRLPLTGSAEQVIADIERFRALGVTNLVFRPGAPDLTEAQAAAQIEFIARHVLPAVRR
ncbi:MAG: TIGR03619 family F420-dependent LLM class oxidoreductase [Gammaproteobacteria bacterium]